MDTYVDFSEVEDASPNKLEESKLFTVGMLKDTKIDSHVTFRALIESIENYNLELSNTSNTISGLGTTQGYNYFKGNVCLKSKI